MARRSAQSDIERTVAKYCKDVQSGKLVTGRLTQLAVSRYLSDLTRKPGKHWRWFFNVQAAERAINFINHLKHSTGEFAGQLFSLQPWQQFILWNLFGWVDSDGWRRFRWAYISLGRGNGKSPLAAAILLYLLCADQPCEQRAELVIAATERGTQDSVGAMVVFSECVRFVESNEILSRRIRKVGKKLIYLPTDSTLFPLGKEAKTKDGMNLHAFVADELHEWRKEHQPLWDKLETAMGKRRQPLALTITTAGSDQSKIWQDQYRDAQNVLKGVWQDEQLFAFIAQADDADAESGLPADDLLAPDAIRKVFPKANPNLGISVKPEYILRQQEKARQNPANLQKLQRYHANQLVRSSQKVIDLALWKEADAKSVPDLARQRCYGGLDLGWRDDLAAFYLVFPLPNRLYASLGWVWTCEENPHRRMTHEPFKSWIAAGRMIVTPGNVTDHRAILAKIKWAKKTFRIGTIALDPNNARAMEVEIVNDLGIDVYAFGQTGKKYNEPIREFLDVLKAGRFLSGDDPVLRFAANNLVVRSSSDGLMMPDKERSDDKIDPMVAMLMGFSECLYNETGNTNSYQNRGLRKL